MRSPKPVGKSYTEVGQDETGDIVGTDSGSQLHFMLRSRSVVIGLVTCPIVTLLLLFSSGSLSGVAAAKTDTTATDGGTTAASANANAIATRKPPIAAALDPAYALFFQAPGKAEAEACKQKLPDSQITSEDDPEPPVTESASPGKRVRMKPFQGLEYQLFLPQSWKADGSTTSRHPVVVFLHGAGDGKFSVMNSQSLPRLLTTVQSTNFDRRECWCLEPRYEKVSAMREAPAESDKAFLEEEEDLHSPLADCDFAETFPAIVVMPQGWLPESPTGWTKQLLSKVVSLTRMVIHTYSGDPTQVVLTGQSAGGAGAWSFASLYPHVWSAVNVICMPASPEIAEYLEGVHLWVVGWTGDGEMGNDDVVQALKTRKKGSVRYTRYLEAPGPPDPKYRSMYNHASYDLIYRDGRLWKWAFSLRNADAGSFWLQGT